MTSDRHPWQNKTHRAWLERGFARLIAFAQPSPLPEGGFAYQTADGSAMPDRPPQLFLTCRMTHVASLGVARGIPGSGRLLDHGIDSLLGAHLDGVHGGWLSVLDATEQRKQAYDHVHVALAAASACSVGQSRARHLLEIACDTIDNRLWREDEGALAESFASDWSHPEPYRGANANMHGVEAFLAVGDVTGEARWHERALRMADRIVNRGARASGWLIPEHFQADWTEDPQYNLTDPHHPFRPYGATPGHSLEWARFLCMLHESSLIAGPGWLLEAASALTHRAHASWNLDGREGLPYTLDWDARPVSTIRLHWPVCEGIQACVAVATATGTHDLDTWYMQLWDHAAARFIDERTGAWINEIDDELKEAGTVWPGRPDYYHSAGAYEVPLLPLRPFMTLAAATEA